MPGSVALDEDLVAAAGMLLAAEEMVETDLVQRRRRCVGGDVAAPHARTLRAVHHDGRVPPDELPELAFEILVAGEPRLVLGGDGVDVVGGGQRRDGDVFLVGALEASAAAGSGPVPDPAAVSNWSERSSHSPVSSGSMSGRYDATPSRMTRTRFLAVSVVGVD